MRFIKQLICWQIYIKRKSHKIRYSRCSIGITQKDIFWNIFSLQFSKIERGIDAFNIQTLFHKMKKRNKLSIFSYGSPLKKLDISWQSVKGLVGSKIKTWFLSTKKLWQEVWCQNHKSGFVHHFTKIIWTTQDGHLNPLACFLSDELIGVYTVFARDTLDGIRDDDGMTVALKYKSP